jgi:D-aminoacyl-tRNA deacylase
MRFAICYSKKNIAGINIIEQYKKIGYAPEIPIIELKKETIFSNDISVKKFPELRNIDFLIFASTHRSEKGEPSLCLHAPGNWRTADLGGEPGKICKTSAYVLKYLFQELNKNYGLNKSNLKNEYNITLEVTHHGPLIEIPCCFIELGSKQEQWEDIEAAKIIAKTILTLQDFNKDKFNWIPAVGIGGPHYAPNFNKIQEKSDYAISHIIPSYIEQITENMIIEAEEKTIEQVKELIIDWKSFNSSERNNIITIIKKLGLKYKKTSEIEK